MFCGECGTQNPEKNTFCKNCGNPLKKSLKLENPDNFAPLTPAALSFPSSQGNVTAQAHATQPAASESVGTPKSRKLLIASIICGVVSAVILPYILGVVAIICGIWVIHKKDKLGVIGVVIGSLVVVVNYFYLVIFP